MFSSALLCGTENVPPSWLLLNTTSVLRKVGWSLAEVCIIQLVICAKKNTAIQHGISLSTISVML